jgi:hypothetical protein
MPVTQSHQSLGGFSIRLRPGGPSNEFVARVNPWDHIFVVPKALGPQPSYASIRETAIFAGRIDELDVDSSGASVSGPSNAVWMGDAQGNGGTGLGTEGPTAKTLNQWLTTGLINATLVALGLSWGRLQNLQTTNITFFRDQLKTVRRWVSELQELCDIPFEWIVNPDGTVDIEGFITNNFEDLIFAWYPYVAIGDTFERTEGISRYATFDRQLQVFGGEISATWDFSNIARTGVAVGNNSPPTVRVLDRPTSILPGRFNLGPLDAWATVSDAQTDVTAQLDAVAKITAQYATIRREWTVSGGSAEVAFHLKPGDWIWLHADNLPGLGSLTYAQEQSDWSSVDAASSPDQRRFPDGSFVNIAGRTVQPVRARVSGIEWPVTDRWHDVYWVSTGDRSGDVTLLNAWMDWDADGPATIECNAAKPKWQLLVPTAETRFGRARETFRNVRAANRRF